jgi:hypothetical protein
MRHLVIYDRRRLDLAGLQVDRAQRKLGQPSSPLSPPVAIVAAIRG